jgi:two-component system, NarL family, response regulator LiaR
MSHIRVRYVTNSRLLAEALRHRVEHHHFLPGDDLIVDQFTDRVDVVVADASAVSPTVRAEAASGRVRLVVLGGSDDPDEAVEAARNGASAWLDRRCTADDLLMVLRGVCRGGAYFPSDVQAAILRALRAEVRADDDPGLLGRLTEREREVLGALSDGLRNREIGDHLGMSYNTVRTHVNEIFRKLGVHTRIDAVRALERTP